MAEKIVVLGTGGTIAGTAATPDEVLAYRAAQLGVDQLLAAVPGLRGVPLVAEQVAQVDSKDMSEAVWQRLLQRCSHWLAQTDVAGIVITHGTDTLEETAFLLQEVLAPDKPVVLTCAMRPASAPQPDGPQNLMDAVTVARYPGAHGVVAVCAGVIHGAREVAKEHPYRLDAFTSGEAGPLGWVEEGRVRLQRPWPISAADAVLAKRAAHCTTWPRVEILMNHAGATGAIAQALLAQGVDGIVVAGTGNGSVSASLEAALLALQEQGVKVWRSTRCAQGQVLPHAGDVLPDARGLPPVKARVRLMLDLLGAAPPQD